MTPWRRIAAENRRIVVLLTAAALINVGLFALVVLPLSNRVRTLELDAASAANALRTARGDHAAARATVAGKTTADEELQKFYRDVLPPDLSGARRITYLKIAQLAAQSNLRMERRSGDQSAEHESTLGKWTVDVSLSGEYSAVRRFLYSLETAPEFLVIEHVALAQGDDRSKGVNVTVHVATYYRAGGDGD